jgi:hypothetical protein
MDMWSARSKLHLISEEKGRKGVLESSLGGVIGFYFNDVCLKQ